MTVDTNSLRHLTRRSNKKCDLQFANNDIQSDLRIIISTRQVTRAMHVRNRICPRVKLIIKIIIILLIIFLGFIKSKSC